MLPLSLRVQCRLIWAIPDANIELQRELLKVSCQKKVSYLLEICLHIMPLSLEQLWCVPVKPYTPSIKAISLGKTSHKNPLLSAPAAPIHTLLAMTIALHRMPSAKAVQRKVAGMQSAAILVLPANNPLSPTKLRRPIIVNAMEKWRKLIWYKLTLRKCPHAMSCLSMQSIVEL